MFASLHLANSIQCGYENNSSGGGVLVRVDGVKVLLCKKVQVFRSDGINKVRGRIQR